MFVSADVSLLHVESVFSSAHLVMCKSSHRTEFLVAGSTDMSLILAHN